MNNKYVGEIVQDLNCDFAVTQAKTKISFVLRRELIDIVKRNKSKFGKDHLVSVSRNLLSPSQSHDFEDDEVSQENIKKDYSAVVEQKRQELNELKKAIRIEQDKNNELLGTFTKDLVKKQINPEKIEEFKTLNEKIARSQKNLSLYQRNIKEYSWMFRNLKYNLQLEFTTKQEFISNLITQIDRLNKHAAYKDLIDKNTFKGLLDNQIFDKMLSINDDRLRNYYYSKITEIFFIDSGRRYIKKTEFIRRWEHL